MLTEARALGEQLGDGEIALEALSWRVPALMASHSARRAPQASCWRWPAGALLKPYVAEHYASALALSRGRLT